MAKVSYGGDPEGYMDPPQMTSTDSAGGISPIAAIFEFLGIHRNVARSPKANKETVKTQGLVSPAATPASDFLDVTGSELAKQDLANYRPLTVIDLPASDFAK